MSLKISRNIDPIENEIGEDKFVLDLTVEPKKTFFLSTCNENSYKPLHFLKRVSILNFPNLS